MSIARIRQLERELEDAATSARAGGSFANEHRRRALRLRRAIMDLKFPRTRVRPTFLSKIDLNNAAHIDALVQHFPAKVKKVKFNHIQPSTREADFMKARKEMARREARAASARRQRGMFKLGEAW